MLELIFLKILLQISIFLLQTVPKCCTSIWYTVKNLFEMIFNCLLVLKNSFFLYGPTPSSAKFAMETFMKFDWHYSVKQWLILLWHIKDFPGSNGSKMEVCQSSNSLNLLNKTNSPNFDKLPFLSQLTYGNVIYLKRKPQNIAIDRCFETENVFTLRGIKSILLRIVLLHSHGCSCLFKTATPTFMTTFRSYYIGLSNELSFVSLSCVVPE